VGECFCSYRLTTQVVPDKRPLNSCECVVFVRSVVVVVDLVESRSSLYTSEPHSCCCMSLIYCLQCFDAVGWAAERASGPEWWGAGVVICLERGSDLHMAQRIPLPLTVSCFSEIQIGFTFLVPAHRVVPDKGPFNVCVCR